MATNKEELPSKDVADFTTELYDYIWTRHRFRSESLEKGFAEKLSLMIENPKEKTSQFDDNIGEAVLCSQYLLRKYCEYSFSRYKNVLIESTVCFPLCAFDVVMNWTMRRNNVFLKVIDSAVIIAEAVLFCDAELDIVIELNKASITFIKIFQTLLQEDFFASGGWDGLKETAIRYYQILHLHLRPYLFMMKLPYPKQYHSCYLTKKLRESPVIFPVESSLLCTKCESTSDLIYCEYVNKNDSLSKYLKKVVNDGSILEDDVLQKAHILIKDYYEFKSKYESEIKEDDNDSRDCFLHVLLGKEEQEDEMAEETKTKKHKKKKSKNNSKKSTEVSFEKSGNI